MVQSGPTEMDETQGAIMDTPKDNPAPAPAPAPPTVPYSWQKFVPRPTLHYITSQDEANLEVSELKPGPFGFDLEWKPTFIKGQPQNRVALVQLANNETILLIQVSAMRSFPENLKGLLEDPAYIKAGTAIQNDSMKIHVDYGINMKSCVDISLLARSVDSQWKGKYTNSIGLARLVAAYENLALHKGSVTRSNWEKVLDDKQKEYASNDAHSGFTIYSRLIEMAKSMDPVPKTCYYSCNIVGGSFRTPSGNLWHPCNPFYDPGPLPPPRDPKVKGSDTKKDTTERGATASLEHQATPAILAPSLSVPEPMTSRLGPDRRTGAFGNTEGVNHGRGERTRGRFGQWPSPRWTHTAAGPSRIDGNYSNAMPSSGNG